MPVKDAGKVLAGRKATGHGNVGHTGIRILPQHSCGGLNSAIAQVVHNLVSYHLPLNMAVNSPRVYLGGNTFNVEPGFDHELNPKLLPEQLKLWKEQTLFFGGVHSVQVAGNQFFASGDARRYGVVRLKND